jgi:hypothetical protein
MTDLENVDLNDFAIQGYKNTSGESRFYIANGILILLKSLKLVKYGAVVYNYNDTEFKTKEEAEQFLLNLKRQRKLEKL